MLKDKVMSCAILMIKFVSFMYDVGQKSVGKGNHKLFHDLFVLL